MIHWIAAAVVVFLVGITLDEIGFFDRGEAYNAQEQRK